MSFVYILRSEKDAKLYVGATDNLSARLAKHNKGLVKSTKSRRPLILVFSQEFKSLSDARKFEWKLKYTPAGGKLKKQLVSKLGDRLTVGHEPLKLSILVRFQVPQPSLV